MTQAEIKFLQDNIINFESVKLGFARNIGHDVLAQYEQVYRNHLDPQFVLTYWCGSCVLDMLQRLSSYFENYMAGQASLTIESVPEPTAVTAPQKKKRK
jgi:hypothetical protein